MFAVDFCYSAVIFICFGNVWSSIVCDSNHMMTSLIGLGLVVISSLPTRSMMIDDDLSGLEPGK